MSLRSVYVSEPSFENDRIRIQGEEHRHLVVVRAEKDELIEIFDGKGNVWTASVESVGKRETVAAMKESRQVTRDSIEVILALALIRVPACGGWSHSNCALCGSPLQCRSQQAA